MNIRLLQGIIGGGACVVGAGFLYKKLSRKTTPNHAHTTFACGCHNPTLNMMTEQLGSEIVPAFVKKTTTPRVTGPDTPRIFQRYGRQSVIRTMAGGDTNSTAEAMGIYGKKIVAVGTLAHVEDEMSKRFPSQHIPHQKLGAKECVIPGFIEPHAHIIMSAIMMSWNDYSPWDSTGLQMKSNYNFDWLSSQLKADLGAVDGDNWLFGMGVDPSLLIQEPYPDDMLGLITNEYLDTISADTPIQLFAASGHTSYLNSIALKKTWDHANEKGNTDFLKKYPTVEEYVQKTNGILNELEEQGPALVAVPPAQLDEMASKVPDNVVEFMNTARSRGVTMVYDAGSSSDMYGILESMSSHFPIHVGVAYMCNGLADFDSFASENTWSPPTMDSLRLYIGSIKLVSDGSNQGITGYQSEHYENEPTYGIFNFGDVDSSTRPSDTAPQTFIELVSRIAEEGWPNMIHANGDQANRYTLQAYEAARSKIGAKAFKKLRNRIEHCSLLWDAEVEKIKALDVSPSFLIGHVGFWGYVFLTYIFGEKAERLDLLKSMVDQEVFFTCHSDSPVTPLVPLRMMEQAVTRKLEWSPQARHGLIASGIPELVEEECISSGEALKALTYNAAWQCHAEELVGSLEPNKLADFVVLSEDPVAMNASNAYKNMRRIKVKQSWIEGVEAVPNA